MPGEASVQVASNTAEATPACRAWSPGRQRRRRSASWCRRGMALAGSIPPSRSGLRSRHSAGEAGAIPVASVGRGCAFGRSVATSRGSTLVRRAQHHCHHARQEADLQPPFGTGVIASRAAIMAVAAARRSAPAAPVSRRYSDPQGRPGLPGVSISPRPSVENAWRSDTCCEVTPHLFPRRCLANPLAGYSAESQSY